jgi:hypothetical protein
MKLAWRTTACGIESIVAAETRNQARSRTARSAFDANFQVKFTEVTARRAPEYDGWAEMDASNACWDETLIRDTIKPFTVAHAEAEYAAIGNVLPMTDQEIDRAVDSAMAMIKAKDN